MKEQKYPDKDLTVVSSVFQFLQTSYYSFLRAENNTLTEHLRREIRFGLHLKEIKKEGETIDGTEKLLCINGTSFPLIAYTYFAVFGSNQLVSCNLNLC